LLKDFQSFINEALTLKKDGGSHYLERVETRLARLELIGFTDKKGEQVSASPDEKAKAQQFFRDVLSKIADPTKSKIFSEADVPVGNIGILRLGKAKVTLSNGEEVEPVFRVYERTDASTGKEVFRTGKCFWLFSVGSQVSTIKLYNVDGNSPSEKKFLINKSIEHLRSEREAEIAKISRVFSVNLESSEELEKRHKVILTPGGISIISLNFNSGESYEQQLESFLKDSLVIKQEVVRMRPDLERESTFSLESIPKQMNVTPEKVWLLEKNEKFNTWGALPILQSKLIKGATGNEVQIKVGKKWLHWLEKPMFNLPVQTDRLIRKGEKIALAKEIGRGSWLVNIGTVTDIAVDSRSSEFPYVKTKGWDSSFIIDGDEATKIFMDFRQANESFSPVLSFKQWSLTILR
jgi:hypothetical protein